MTRYLFSTLLLLILPLLTFAQVDNYSVKFNQTGSVNLGSIADLNEQSSYTLQFWMNPSAWTEGAVILKRGVGTEKWAVELGTTNELVFSAGAETVRMTSPKLSANNWNQITLVNNDGQVKIYLNNELTESTTSAFKIPTSSDELILGGNLFEGRIDELRIWRVAIEDTFFHLWRNTLNKHHPQYDDLVAYYKFDQNLSPDVVDYKLQYHGAFSSTGAERELVNDNPHFKYRKAVAYTTFQRWADRQIDSDKYLLVNDLIILGIQPASDGSVTLPFPYSEGTVTNGGYLASYKGRDGVLSLNGAGSFMDVGTKVLNSSVRYSFSSWIYLEEWTEGAFIFKKEKSDTEGFSIRLGDEDKKRIIIRVNGVEYSRINQMKVNEWIHVGVAAYSTTKNQVYQTTFNGVTSYATNNTQEENSYLISGLEKTHAFIGLDLNAKFDETVMWNDFRSEGNMQQAMTYTPMPDSETLVEASTLNIVDGYWDYNNPDNVGYDSYSAKHFIALMRKNFENHRGFMIRGSVASFDGWQSRMGDAAFREKLADELAVAVELFDGLDLDFEWCYDGTCWDNYGKTIAAIKSKLPADKVFTVSPHAVSYGLATKYMPNVDYFPFQIYGPGKHVFLWQTYVNSYNNFINQGFPKEKIVLSFAATTSRAYDPVTDQELAVAPIGVRNNLLNGDYTPDMSVVIDDLGYRRYITGYNQVIDRCEFIQDKDLGGVMYWDMGNDVKTSHPYSLAKAASYSINSNVDLLITDINNIPTSIKPVTKANSGILVYPNPAKNEINVSLLDNREVSKIEMMDIKGTLIASIVKSEKLLLQNVVAGVYFLNVTSEVGDIYSSKIIIE